MKKVMNFGDSINETVEIPNCSRLLGPKRALFNRNRVKLIIIFLGDFFLALDKDGDGSVGCKDFASRMAASGKLPAGVDIESAIATVMYLS